LKNDQLAHAFLFSGPRGVGKTTSARILAKVLNCQNLQDGYKSCGECQSCQSFVDNASFNIFELDAASNNSVDHIRALNEQVRFQPQQGSYKIYIIDEVHMLSQAAFNAFLKTLEEPPPYAKFILATTEKHKIIPTILSRCQIFDFKRIQIKDIIEQLSDIAKKEKRVIKEDALHLIAQKADGAMRDALSIYDKVISSVEGDITYKEVANNLNVLDYDYYFKIVDAAIKEDLAELMIINDDIIKKGFEAEQFVIGLMAHLRDLLMIKDLRTAEILDIAESLKSRYEDQANLANNSFILSALSLLNQTDINLPRSQNKRLAVEVALSKLCYMNRLITKKKTEELTQSKQGIDKSAPVAPIVQSSAKQVTSEQSQPRVKPEIPKKQVSKKPPPPKKPEVNIPKVPTVANEAVIKTPTISTNLDALIQNVGKKKSLERQSDKPFSEKALIQLFNDYKSKTSSPSVQAAIDNIKIMIDGSDIKILAPTRIYLDFVRQELDLIESIHGNFGNSYDKILYVVSEETFPEYVPPKKPKHLTTKEKFDVLVVKNPQFEKLVKELKLKPLNH